jgi:hypothetical protein
MTQDVIFKLENLVVQDTVHLPNRTTTWTILLNEYIYMCSFYLYLYYE